MYKNFLQDFPEESTEKQASGNQNDQRDTDTKTSGKHEIHNYLQC